MGGGGGGVGGGGGGVGWEGGGGVERGVGCKASGFRISNFGSRAASCLNPGDWSCRESLGTKPRALPKP